MSYSTPESQNAITQRMTKVASASVRPFIRTVPAPEKSLVQSKVYDAQIDLSPFGESDGAIMLHFGCPESIEEDLAIIDAGALPLSCV
jgi:hypothetical protein